MAKSDKKPKKDKALKASNSGQNAPADLDADKNGTIESSAMNAAAVADLETENAQLKADLAAMREGDSVSVSSDLNPAVHCKSYIVTPKGKQAKVRGLQARKIDYACDGSEAIRQYACSYVGSGKEAQSLVSDFTYVTEEVMDRRPRTIAGHLLFDLPIATMQGDNGPVVGQKELVETNQVYYIKGRELVRWPDKQYANIEAYRPKHVKQPLTVAS